MRKRTHEQCRAELAALLPWLKSDWVYLNRVLKRMEAVRPEAARQVQVFRLYFGLAADEPLNFTDIGRKFGHSLSWASQSCQKVRRRLNHPSWRDEEKWPEPEVSTTLSKMRPYRVDEIAVLLQMWRYQNTGTKRYMQELQMAAEELKISDGEMLQFYQAIADRLMRRK